MLREDVWYSYDKDNQWLSFDTLKVVHKVTEVLTGERYSITPFHSRQARAFDHARLGHTGQIWITHLSVRVGISSDEEVVKTRPSPSNGSQA